MLLPIFSEVHPRGSRSFFHPFLLIYIHYIYSTPPDGYDYFFPNHMVDTIIYFDYLKLFFSIWGVYRLIFVLITLNYCSIGTLEKFTRDGTQILNKLFGQLVQLALGCDLISYIIHLLKLRAPGLLFYSELRS